MIQQRKPGVPLPFVGDLEQDKDVSWDSVSSTAKRKDGTTESLILGFLIQNRNCTG